MGAVNQCGPIKQGKFCGDSLLVDQWGEVIAEAGEDEEIVRGEFDLAVIRDIRERINVFRDRRPEVYG